MLEGRRTAITLRVLKLDVLVFHTSEQNMSYRTHSQFGLQLVIDGESASLPGQINDAWSRVRLPGPAA